MILKRRRAWEEPACGASLSVARLKNAIHETTLVQNKGQSTRPDNSKRHKGVKPTIYAVQKTRFLRSS